MINTLFAEIGSRLGLHHLHSGLLLFTHKTSSHRKRIREYISLVLVSLSVACSEAGTRQATKCLPRHIQQLQEMTTLFLSPN